MESTPLLGSNRPANQIEPDDSTDTDPQPRTTHKRHDAGPANDMAGGIDPYEPLEMNAHLPLEDRTLTARAILVGLGVGLLVNTSNMYLGLKTGFGFPGSFIGATLGYAVLKPLASIPGPIVGGHFGPRENSIVQSVSVAAGGMPAIFAGAVPALYMAGLEVESPKDRVGMILCITLFCALLGLFFATPFRRLFIFRLARELRLLFPTATGVAITLKSLHEGSRSGGEATGRLGVLGLSFVGAFTHRVLSNYANCVLYDWHLFTWVHVFGGYREHWAMALESWGWYVEWTPAFIGSGMLMRPNTTYSLILGALLAWGLVGPILVSNGECVGIKRSDSPRWADYYDYSSLQTTSDGKVSPRYWLLWPGVMVMVTNSMIEMSLQYKILWGGIMSLWSRLRGFWRASPLGQGTETDPLQHPRSDFREDRLARPDSSDREVPVWLWASGLLLSVAFGILVLGLNQDMSPGLVLLASGIACILFLAVLQVAAVTDQASIGTMAKVSQLVFGVATRSLPTASALRANLLAGSLVAGTAEVGIGLMSDFRTGFLLGTPPRPQWLAQAIGTLAATFFSPGIFILFCSAYPCIIDAASEKCAFRVPVATSWLAVARAVTDSALFIPRSSVVFAIAMSVLSLLQTLARHYTPLGRSQSVIEWLPNWSAVALGFILPEPAIPCAAVTGALSAQVWHRRNRKSYESYMYMVAAGLIAGEGLGGSAGAALEIWGLSSDRFGTEAGCPGHG
ncbi:metal-nicotianamine transporter YSL5 [Apiospora arundinis]